MARDGLGATPIHGKVGMQAHELTLPEHGGGSRQLPIISGIVITLISV